MEEVERMERRERDKQERAKMSLIQNNEPEPEMPSLFSAPFRVSKCRNISENFSIKLRCIVYVAANKSDRERSANSI